jgi:hypothetical protein
MGSLQTEIQKTLNSWGTAQPPVANSIARKVFDFVQNNPSCSSNAVVQATGIDLGRASATLLTLYQKGKLDRKPYPNPNPEGKRDTIYHYWTSVDNFTDRGEKRMAKKPKKDKALSKVAVPVIDLETPVYQMPRMKQVAVESPYSSASVILNNMSIQVASDVYKALKEMFK